MQLGIKLETEPQLVRLKKQQHQQQQPNDPSTKTTYHF